MMVLFYSAYGHLYRLAESVAEGARAVDGVEVDIKRVPETLTAELTAKLGITEAQKAFSHIPVAEVEQLADYDAVVFGAPTRFGNVSAQMRAFMDGAGPLWLSGALVGKVGSIFTGSATQHGGQESTILSFLPTLLHLGYVYVGLPYAFAGQNIVNEITGCSPYGASTISGPKGERMPSENELSGARFQGNHVANIAVKLAS